MLRIRFGKAPTNTGVRIRMNPARQTSSAPLARIVSTSRASKASRVGKSLCRTTSVGIPCFAARTSP